MSYERSHEWTNGEDSLEADLESGRLLKDLTTLGLATQE